MRRAPRLLTSSEARVRDMEAALRFYADESNYYDPYSHGYGSADRGARARAALGVATEGTAPCGACGGSDDVRHRGWHDEGSPMPTCSKCGSPGDSS